MPLPVARRFALRRFAPARRRRETAPPAAADLLEPRALLSAAPAPTAGDRDHADRDHAGHDHHDHDHHDHDHHDHAGHDHAGHDHAGHDHHDHAGHCHCGRCGGVRDGGPELHVTPLPDRALGPGEGGTGDYYGTGDLLPLDQTFRLHSQPGADHTIYLNFDGHVTEDPYWNGGDRFVTDPFSRDGDAAFSDRELRTIQASGSGSRRTSCRST